MYQEYTPRPDWLDFEDDCEDEEEEKEDE